MMMPQPENNTTAAPADTTTAATTTTGKSLSLRRLSKHHGASGLLRSSRQQHRQRNGGTPSPHANHNAVASFLLSNLHCPSCVSFIKSVIHDTCGDDAIWVSPNVVTSVVTVEHKDTMRGSVAAMARALEEAGFDICGVTSTISESRQRSLDGGAATNAAPAPTTVTTVTASPDGVAGSSGAKPAVPAAAAAATTKDSLDGIIHRVETIGTQQRLQRSDRAATQNSLVQRFKRSSTAKQRAHLENCEACQHLANTPHTSANPASPPPPLPSCPAGAAPSDTDDSANSSSCHQDMATRVVSSRSSTGNTTQNSVSVLESMEPPDVAAELTSASAGTQKAVPPLRGVVTSTTDDRGSLCRLTIAIGGMTCAVCVNTITQELGKRPWVEKAVVNLVSNSATVDFYNESRAQKIIDAIEDLGYDATIDKVVNLDQEQRHVDEREIEVRIDGIFCNHCPERIISTMGWFQKRGLEVLSEPTMDAPILKIRYTPETPTFTVRHILAAIEATDPELRASVYHAPTLEERSRMMTRRHYLQLLWRVVLAAVIAVPTFILGIVYMSLVSDSNRSKMMLMEPLVSGISKLQIILFALATPVYFVSASIFHTRTLKEVHSMWRRGSRTPILQRFYKFGSMNMLMSLGTTIAYLSSVGQMIWAAAHKPQEVPNTEFYFDSVVFLTLFLLIGRLIESYTKSKTGDAVEALVKLRPTSASLVENGRDGKQTTTAIHIDQLELGDTVRVNKGASPPADGVVVQGETTFDESSLTGESRPISKVPGDDVFAGTVNQQGPIMLRVTGTGGSSMLDQIVAVVREGQTRRAPLEAIADVMTAYFVPAITVIAVTTWLIWLGLSTSRALPDDYVWGTGGPVQFSLQFSIAVFVVACPCGLALAAPTAIFVGGGIAANHGILAKGGGESFEKASKIDVVVFDKTGTLTAGGEPTVTDSAVFPDEDSVANEDARKVTLLTALKAVEENSSHPIARAIVGFCTVHKAMPADSLNLGDIHEIPGRGMRSKYASKAVKDATESDILIGNEPLMRDYAIPISPRVSSLLQTWKDQAKSVALVATKQTTAATTTTSTGAESSTPSASSSADWAISAILAISDPIREETPAVVGALKARGLKVWMLSGDNASTARAVAARVGIDADKVLAEVLPSEKADKIKYLQASQSPRPWGGRATVAMVGDGINDSPALTAADVGVAIGSGSDVAISSADFVLITSDLRSVVTLLGLSKRVFQRIKTNFGWACVYNMIAVPVAAGVFYPIKGANGEHVRLDPVWASLAMALSSISVVVSSLLLRARIPGVGFRVGEIKVHTSEQAERM